MKILNFVRKLTGKPSTRMRSGLRCARFWRHKKTGVRFEVTKFLNVVPDNELKVVAEAILDDNALKSISPEEKKQFILSHTYPWVEFIKHFKEDGNLGSGNWGKDKDGDKNRF